jgi:hypothetical protein
MARAAERDQRLEGRAAVGDGQRVVSLEGIARRPRVRVRATRVVAPGLGLDGGTVAGAVARAIAEHRAPSTTGLIGPPADMTPGAFDDAHPAIEARGVHDVAPTTE